MLALKIAARYLFAKKSHNAINAITVVASCGVAIITTALICVLSVFNGFEDLVGKLTSQMDPALKVIPMEGKTFQDTPELRQKLQEIQGIEAISATLEETILIINGGRQIPARMMGVDSLYQRVTKIDSILWNGDYILKDDAANYAILGVGLSQKVSCRPGYLRPMSFYCPKRKGKIDITDPESAFVSQEFFCSAQFAVQQSEYDDYLCLVDIHAARTLLQDSALCSAYEIRLVDKANEAEIQKSLDNALRPYQLLTQNRYQQQADNYRIVQVEKWVTFLLILFIILIASFNIIGSLSMLIIDKEEEIETLKNLGASIQLIRRIFAIEGWLISGSGAIIGILLGSILCMLQEQYGFIGLGDGSSLFVVDSYPVRLIWSDVFWSALAVLAIGLTASLIPLKGIKQTK